MGLEVEDGDRIGAAVARESRPNSGARAMPCTPSASDVADIVNVGVDHHHASAA